MNEGDTQGETPDLPSGLYAGYTGKTETEEAQATEQEDDGGNDGGTETTPAETPKAESTTSDWEARHREAQSFIGRQGQEIGELRKELSELKAQLGKQQQPDIAAQDPTLAALDPKQRDMLLRGGDVALKRLLQDAGMTVQDLPDLKSAVQQIQEYQAREAITREVTELRNEFGEAEFNRYVPQMETLARQYPNLSPRQVWNLATADDLRKGQSSKAKALEAERKQRAASADFGKERPNPKQDGKLTQESLRKLSNKQKDSGPSPRFKALLNEAIRNNGG